MLKRGSGCGERTSEEERKERRSLAIVIGIAFTTDYICERRVRLTCAPVHLNSLGDRCTEKDKNARELIHVAQVSATSKCLTYSDKESFMRNARAFYEDSHSTIIICT